MLRSPMNVTTREEDAHTNAIAQAQNTRLQKPQASPNPKPGAKSESKTSIFDDVSEALYIPAFNKAFSDLTLKPFNAGASFIDRTMNKAYTAITGDKEMPTWMQNNQILENFQKSVDKGYEERKKPTNLASDVVEGVVGTLPLMASLYTGAGEAQIASKAPQLISKVTKLLATTGALNAYKDATESGQGYGESLKSAAKGGVQGALSGLTIEAQMLLGGALGKNVVGKLVEKGLFKGGKATEAVLHALSVGTVFGGTSAGEDLLNGKDIDVNEAMKQFGMGLAFESIPVIKGVKSEIGDVIESKSVDKKALQSAVMASSASNMNAESALRTLINTPTEQLIKIKEEVPGTHEDLYADSIEQGAKAYETKDVREKKDLYVNQLALKAQGDVKLLADKLKTDREGMLNVIMDNTELTPEQTAELVDKVTLLDDGKAYYAGYENPSEPAPANKTATKLAASAPTESLPTPEVNAEQNAEMDTKIKAFQEQFPDQQVDPLEDLPEQVVRTFERVEADVPTDPTAINETSDWLYNKYKQLTAMKASDTRRLTIDQIEGMQKQLEEDITLLENHKTKYHGEEQPAEEAGAVTEVQAETKPAEQAVAGADESTGTIEQSPQVKQVADEQAKPSNEISKEILLEKQAEGSVKIPDEKVEPVNTTEQPVTTTAKITPQKSVKASIKMASNEVSTNYGLRGSEGETLYNKFKDKEVQSPYGRNYTEPKNEKDIVNESEIPAVLKNAYKALDQKGYLHEYDGDYYLTEDGKKYVDAVKARIETRKGIKDGTDLFPHDAGLLPDEVDKLKSNLTKEEKKEAESLPELEGVTIDEIINYEQSIERTGDREEQPDAGTDAEAVSEPKDDAKDGAGKNPEGEGVEGLQQERPLTKEEKIRQEISDAEKEFNDFIKESRKQANTIGNLGEFIGKATKLLTAYTKLGVYKFSEVISKMRASFGDDFVDENINEIKGAYAYTRSIAEKSERDKFDTEDAMDVFIESGAGKVTTEAKESPVGPKTEPVVRDDMANLKEAALKKKSIQNQVKKEAPRDELLKEFATLDPQYMNPDEVERYNELTREKKPTDLQRDEIAKFLDDVRFRQEEDAEKREAEWFKKIMDDDVSEKEAKELLTESADTTDEQPDLENTETDKKAKNAFSKIITQYKKQLRGSETQEGMDAVKNALIEIDETKLSTKQAREIAKVMDNILYDGNYAGSGKAVALNKAIVNAKYIMEDLTKRGFDKGDISQFWSDFRTLDQNVEMISKSTKGASVIQEKSGIQEISAGNAKVNKLANDISKELNAMTDKMGGKILSVDNRYKRGILASILQVADTDTKEGSYERYKNYIKETGEILSKSKEKAEQLEGELVTKLYNQFLSGSETAEQAIEALAKDNPNNAKIVNFMVKKFEGTYGDLRRNTMLYNGKDLPFIQSYTPTQMKRLRGFEELKDPDVSITDPLSFDGRQESTDTKASRTTISRKQLKTLKGLNRVLNLDFDGLALNKYREANYDIQTMESRHLFDNIRKLADFKDALGGRRNVNVISDGVAQMVKRQKGFNKSDPVARAVMQVLNVATAKGVRIALQGQAQWIKQYPSVGLNTLVNLGKDMDLYVKSITKIGLNHPIFNESGIGLRGSQHGGTSFELEMRRMRNTDFEGPVVKAMANLSKVGDKISKVFTYALSKSDDAVARNSWGAYYMKDLRRQGVDLDNVDWDVEHKNINKEAAAYAEQMVSRNQIQNDPSKQANFLYSGDIASARDVGAQILKGVAMPFSSFARNAQARFESDVRKFNGGDRKEAALSLTAGIAEAVAFNAIKIAMIASGVNWAASKVLPQFGFQAPVDKPLDERAQQIAPQAINDMLLSGFGTMGNYWVNRGLNGVYKYAKDDSRAELIKQFDPNMFGEPDFGMAGIYGVLPSKIYQVSQEINYAGGTPTGEAWDAKNHEMAKYQSQLTDRQKNLAQLVLVADILGMLGISDAEALRVNQKVFREIKKEKAPVKFHQGFNKNSKSDPVKINK